MSPSPFTPAHLLTQPVPQPIEPCTNTQMCIRIQSAIRQNYLRISADLQGYTLGNRLRLRGIPPLEPGWGETGGRSAMESPHGVTDPPPVLSWAGSLGGGDTPGACSQLSFHLPRPTPDRWRVCHGSPAGLNAGLAGGEGRPMELPGGCLGPPPRASGKDPGSPQLPGRLRAAARPW